jgi:hypothetical protein
MRNVMKTDLNAAQRSFVLASLLLLGGLPAGADWLITREGGRVETQGSWQVKGKLVVFTQANGSLSSLRLADVDLEASQQATAEAIQAEDTAATAEKAPRPERKKSIRSLTDDDFGHSGEPAGPAARPAGGADAGKDAAGKDAGKETRDAVAVSSWRQSVRTEGDGLDLLGTLQNTGGELATDIAVKVELFNEAKESVATAVAILGSSSIPAGGSTTFRVPFDGVFTFASAKFQVSSKALTLDVAPDGAEGEKAARKKP